MQGDRGFERERDWTQGPAKWAAVVVLGAACVLTSAWVITGRVPIERRTAAAERASTNRSAPVSESATVAPPPPLSLATEAVGPAEPAPPPAQAGDRASGDDNAASIARRININTASAAELELLPGVGPKLAERIVEHRRVHGPFKSVDDLDSVSGIGPRILERLRELVTVE